MIQVPVLSHREETSCRRDFAGGLTQSQLDQVSFFSGPGSGFLGSALILSNGELVPVPEPGAVFTVLGLLGLIGYRERFRQRKDRR